MTYFWHQSQWQAIDRLLKTKRLPHAMMLLGSEGLGKAEFAKTLASAVLCQRSVANDKASKYRACGRCKSCQLLKAGTHPDLYHLKPTAAATSKSKKPVMSIKIDEIRDLCSQLNQTSQYGLYRVAILDKAESLTIPAANSLLKTLEEPGENVLILLVSSRPHRLPITIRSRCQTLRFAEPEEKLTLSWLQQHNKQHATTEQLLLALKQSHGSPLSALKALEQIEHYQLLTEAMTACICGKNSLDYSMKLTKFDKVKTLEVMLSWVSDLTRIIACGPDAEIVNVRDRVSLQKIANKVNQRKVTQRDVYNIFDQLNFNLSHSSITLNEQLLWENLLLSWDNL